MSEAVTLEGATGGRDENKISTFSVPYYVETLADVVTVGAGNYHGLVESTRSWQAWNAGTAWLVTVIYKGHLEDDPDAEDPVQTEQWTVDFDFSEEPIESHPKLAKIKEFYGGYTKDNELVFPEILPNGSKGKSGLGKSGGDAGEKNPMHGVSTYAVMTARVTRSWSTKDIPKNAVNDIAKIYRKIPDAPNGIDAIDFGDRTWMAMPPKISQNGNVWRIENEWLLSPPAGWVEQVYEKGEQ
jgi:hypothetical protein